MRKACLIFATLVPFWLQAQKVDRFRVNVDLSSSLTRYRLIGPYDFGKGVKTTVGNRIVEVAPVYKGVDTSVFSLNFWFHLNFNIPFYRTSSWSIGGKSGLGIGYQKGIRAEDADFSSLVFDSPNYLYFRHNKKYDFTILFGYKYVLGPVPYGVNILAFDYNFDARTAVRFYFTPVRRVYYRQLTTGELKPALKVTEFGVSFTF